jgi:hypothetical protein
MGLSQIHHRRSAEKEPNRGKATLHSADRQPCGYKSIHQRGAIACPWYQSLRNREGYFGGTTGKETTIEINKLNAEHNVKGKQEET